MRTRFTLALLCGLLALPAVGRGAEDGFFDSNGVKIHYVTEGRGEPVLLIHGFTSDVQGQWVAPGIFPALAKDYRVIALDNRGHGKSDKPHDPRQYGTEMVEDAVRLLDHLKIDRAHVVGYSMGGTITCKLLVTHPDRLLTATLGGSGGYREGAIPPRIEALADSLEQGKGFGPLIEFLTPAGQPKPSEEMIKAINQRLEAANDTKALAAVIRGMKNLAVTDEQLKANKVPTLALIGEIDPLKPGVDSLKDRLANYKAVVIPGADHITAFHSPMFLKELQAFLAAHRQGEKPAEGRDRPRPAAPPRVVSPEVHADRTVTFRLRAPNAHEVKLTGEVPGGARALTRDEQGVWGVTVGPLPPELYGYSFVVDGLTVPDPGNARVKPMRSPTTSILDLPGDPPLVHDFQDVPHGTVRLHEYRSHALGTLRRLRVYTPPGYDQDRDARYPVLYLFHGSGDNEATWTELGRAHVILDNLIAQGKARPMLVVMPDGHAAPPTPEARGRNTEDFERDLLEDVLPLVEKGYRVKADRLHRAIIGLSMGGGQSLTIGLNHLDRFAWVGGMSSYVPDPEKTVARAVNDPEVNDKLKMLWIAIGKDDFLLRGARQLDEALTRKNVKHTFLVTEGNHSWPVWRRYLAQFAPLLFTEG